MAAKITAIMNQKGGVGKTTTTVNLGAVLANEFGKRVLLVDLDPQGNTSDHVGLDPNLLEDSVYDVLAGGDDAEKHIRHVQGLDVLPANVHLSGAEVELAGTKDWISRLAKALQPLRGRYDYIFLDCPPSLGILTVSGLAAADEVLVPMEAEYLALRGVGQINRTVDRVAAGVNPGLKITGVLFCMFDNRTTLAKDVRNEVENHFPGKVFATAIRKNVRLAEAPSRGMTILEYEPRSPGADDYRALAREFLERNEPEMYETDILSEIPPDVAVETVDNSQFTIHNSQL